MQAVQPKPLDFVPRTLLSVIRRTPLNRGPFRRVIMKAFKKYIDHPVVTDFRGVPFILHMDNTTETKALFGHYNLEELAFLAAGIAGKDDPVFVDLGANCGFYTQNFLGHGRGRVLAIEPNPAMCVRIEENHALLRQERTDNAAALLLERCAVGDERGEVNLDLKSGFGAANVVDRASATTITVPVALLTDVLAKHGIASIDVLKIDIEGYEDKALMPFFATAPAALYPRRIIIEYTSGEAWSGDLMGLLKEKGYAEQGRTRGNLLLALQG